MTQSGNWQPTAGKSALRNRADALAAARQFFHQRGVLEVETPVLGNCGVTDAGIDSLAVARPDGKDWWLRSSPEYHMKRLLASDSGDIYQIGKVFRAGEEGSHHQNEFTMAEWYRLGFDLEAMIGESCEFINAVTTAAGGSPSKPRIHSYREAFLDTVQLDPLEATPEQLITIARDLPGWHDHLQQQLSSDRSIWLDFIASHGVYPRLAHSGLQVVRDYPAEQAMLARLNPEAPQIAERFEIFLNGVELANGFRELRDAAEQRQRFVGDNLKRAATGLPEMAIDEKLLAALNFGLPDCCGVAVGLDRVLMLAGGQRILAETLSFPPGR